MLYCPPKNWEGGERKGKAAAEGKDKEEAGAGDIGSGLEALRITTPSLGVIGTCGNGRSEQLRGWLKVTEWQWHTADSNAGSWHLNLPSWQLLRCQRANGRAGMKEGPLGCKYSILHILSFSLSTNNSRISHTFPETIIIIVLLKQLRSVRSVT